MNHARVIRRPTSRGAGTAASEKSSGGKARWIIAAIVLLLLAGGAWAFLPGKDPALAKIEEIRAQIEQAPEAQRRELFGQMRDEFKNLRPESRDQMRDQWRQRGEAREQKFYNDLFSKTTAQQIAQVDQQIKEEEQRRQEREQRRAQDGNRRGDQGRGGPGNAQRGGNGNRGGDGNRGSRGRGDSLERRKSYLDNTTPQARAQRSEYRRMREERRQALGLPPSRGRR
jgi:uncharacterized membrane protein YgcG